MWKYIVRLILRQRVTVLIVLGLLTVFMAWQATQSKMSYDLALMLPDSDSTVIKYNRFREIFGQDGSVLYLGVVNPKINELDQFNHWYDLTHRLHKIKGVEETLSIAKTFIVIKDDSLKKFILHPIFSQKPQSQKELDSLLSKVYNQPFYEGLLFNKENGSTLMAITLDKDMINSKSRFELLDEITAEVSRYEEIANIKIHYSGLPYIRTVTSKIIKEELLMFTLLTLLIASLALYFFFRSFKAVFYPMLIVVISVIWTMGFLQVLGYKVSILTGILPPLIIVLAVENNIFLLNKYHSEFKNHRNKIKALSRMIQRVGSAMLLTNLTTAVGFAAFIITRNNMLTEFGIVASLSIMMVFVLSLFLIPIFFSFVSEPKDRHIKHLDRKGLHYLVKRIINIVSNHRTVVYWVTTFFIAFGIYGMTLMKTTGSVVDDIPKEHPMYQDLLFFEKQFNGILPFEIMIDAKKPRAAMKMATLKRISKLQDTLATYSDFSKSVSVADVVKVVKQAYYQGDPAKYSLPNSYEQAFILKYLPKDMSFNNGKRTILNSFVDSTMQITRISVQMSNLSSPEIDALRADLKPKIDSLFKPDKYNVTVTGTSVVFSEGTTYLTDNLIYSLILAVILIGFIMALLFNSLKMVSIALLPNLIPQLMTVALMGYFGIPLKPSTILIFSIALGISVDNTIHYLSRYRMELKLNNFNIRISVINALRETANSMIYSSIVLFLGFSVFILSSFGGTQSLGKLISFTLLTAMLSNLVLLPSLLLTLDKRLTTKSFNEPFIDVFDEEEDIELDNLEIERD